MKYRALRVLAVVLKILAWVVLVAGLIVSLTVLFATSLISQSVGTPVPFSVRFFTFLAMVGFTLVQFVFYLGAGEAISLLFDIDENTRMRPAGVGREEKKAA